MMQSLTLTNQNDTYHTDGVKYRTPAHPEMVSALGRAMWNFLNLEEQVVAVLFESKFKTLKSAREGTAGTKMHALSNLLVKMKQEQIPEAIIAVLQTGIDAFTIATKECRNVIAHGTPYTAGHDENGTYVPGLYLRMQEGPGIQAKAVNIHLEVGLKIEEALDAISAARDIIKEYLKLKPNMDDC